MKRRKPFFDRSFKAPAGILRDETPAPIDVPLNRAERRAKAKRERIKGKRTTMMVVDEMVAPPGFEPGNVGFKVRCL